MTELKNEILSGSLKPGEFILPENTLSEKYKISRVSVRKVLAQLVDEGLIEKIAGKGNRVKPPAEQIARQTIKLAWFSGSYEQEVLKTIIEHYEASHPYVKVELDILSSYVQELVGLIEQGSGPDLFFMSDAFFRHFMETDKLNLIEPYTPSKLTPDTSYGKLFDIFTLDGTLLAVPIHFSPIVICYNKTMFDEAGISSDDPIRTWDDLLRVARACTAAPNEDGMIDQYGFCFSSSMNRWPAILLQNGGRFKSEDGTRSVFGNERNVEALQFCSDLMYKHQVSPIYSHSSSYLAEHIFKRKRCAMILSTYYFMNEFRGLDLRWDVLPVPKKREKATLLLCGALSINKYSDKIKVAQSFIDFFVGEEAQTLLKRAGCTIPALKSVAQDNSLLDPDIHPEHYNTFIDAVNHSYSHRELGVTNEDNTIALEELHTLWANMDTAEDVCRRIEERTNRVLQEQRQGI
ncbi:extracellular solute-binding protein [Paenibacillus ginsengarvi]|uniref:extracellular solute-binding protein n=1 Tax=Paenibacillus ginsengarvi TaxID=400777 RepID=UPI001F032D7C|nr:extracellular solute-binding protein [Paenibacillus ginsengarvi]